jgi:hypothetical protein
VWRADETNPAVLAVLHALSTDATDATDSPVPLPEPDEVAR